MQHFIIVGVFMIVIAGFVMTLCIIILLENLFTYFDNNLHFDWTNFTYQVSMIITKKYAFLPTRVVSDINKLIQAVISHVSSGELNVCWEAGLSVT